MWVLDVLLSKVNTAKKAVEKARKQVAGMLHCDPSEVFFTSGGTESNNHAIMGMARALKDKGNHLITSKIEHPAVLEVCQYLESEGFETSTVDVDDYGMVGVDQIASAIRPETILITIMHANNEVGTIQHGKCT
jgi:cysteine desulfurase